MSSLIASMRAFDVLVLDLTSYLRVFKNSAENKSAIIIII